MGETFSQNSTKKRKMSQEAIQFPGGFAVSFDEEGEVLKVTYRDGTERVFENLKMGKRVFVGPSAKRDPTKPPSEEPRRYRWNWH